MSKADLTVDEAIKDLVQGIDDAYTALQDGDHREYLEVKDQAETEAKAALTTLVEDVVAEIIGEDEYSEGASAFAPIVPNRNELRETQRQRAKAELKKRGFTNG